MEKRGRKRQEREGEGVKKAPLTVTRVPPFVDPYIGVREWRRGEGEKRKEREEREKSNWLVVREREKRGEESERRERGGRRQEAEVGEVTFAGVRK